MLAYHDTGDTCESSFMVKKARHIAWQKTPMHQRYVKLAHHSTHSDLAGVFPYLHGTLPAHVISEWKVVPAKIAAIY